MELKAYNSVDHLYFGVGTIISHTELYYTIKFSDGEVRNILKGHSTLKKRTDNTWTIEEKEKALKHIQKEAKKDPFFHGNIWRNYQHLLEE